MQHQVYLTAAKERFKGNIVPNRFPLAFYPGTGIIIAVSFYE